MKRKGLAYLALCCAMVLPACGGGDSPAAATPPAPTPTPGPSQATITVTCNSFSVATSSRAGFSFRITFPCTISESAGLGANMNFIRARFTRGGVEVERQEIGANDIIAGFGSNRVNANATVTGTFFFDFNRGDATGGILDFNFTDDRGNVLTSTFNF
jgi:hypothetical protein